VGAAYFWRLGDEWAAKKTRPGGTTSTNQPYAKPLAKPAGQATVNGTGNLNTPPQSSTTLTNSTLATRVANRLSNTTKTVGQLTHSDNAILLQNALIDTGQPASLAIPEHLRVHGDPG